MTIDLNHTIVAARDKAESATFLSEILGLPAPVVDYFAVVDLDNGVSLDFEQATGDITSQHYAFLVDDNTFDEVFARVESRRLTYWADPFRLHPGELRTANGRGFYFEDPSGHFMEVLTRG